MNSKRKKDLRAEYRDLPAAIPETLSPATGAPDEGAVAAPDISLLSHPVIAPTDDYLHLAADFDNFKKRTRRDSEQQAAAQKEAFISELLPVLDNLERALAAGQSTATEQLQQGVTMTLQQLSQLLHRHGIEAVEDVGRFFDPHRHEAVSVQRDRSQPDQIVLAVTERGYCHGDRVFRPAKVVVNDLSQSAGASHAS